MIERLSCNARKCLAVQLGEPAAEELIALFDAIIAQIERLNCEKVERTPIVPDLESNQ
jgi:hypothetical protein